MYNCDARLNKNLYHIRQISRKGSLKFRKAIGLIDQFFSAVQCKKYTSIYLFSYFRLKATESYRLFSIRKYWWRWTKLRSPCTDARRKIWSHRATVGRCIAIFAQFHVRFAGNKNSHLAGSVVVFIFSGLPGAFVTPGSSKHGESAKGGVNLRFRRKFSKKYSSFSRLTYMYMTPSVRIYSWKT